MVRQLTSLAGNANHFIRLSDAVGTGLAVGEDVDDFAPGYQIMSCSIETRANGRLNLPALTSAHGADGREVLTDHTLLSAGGISKMLSCRESERAFAVRFAGVPAWNTLMSRGNLKSANSMLSIGTSDGALITLQTAVAAAINYVAKADQDAAVHDACGSGVNHVGGLGAPVHWPNHLPAVPWTAISSCPAY